MAARPSTLTTEDPVRGLSLGDVLGTRDSRRRNCMERPEVLRTIHFCASGFGEVGERVALGDRLTSGCTLFFVILRRAHLRPPNTPPELPRYRKQRLALPRVGRAGSSVLADRRGRLS